MSSSRIDTILQEILALPLVEQSELRAVLERLWTQSAPAQEAELDRRLLEKGILTHVPATGSSHPNYHFSPISVTGKPVSQTLLEERR